MVVRLLRFFAAVPLVSRVVYAADFSVNTDLCSGEGFGNERFDLSPVATCQSPINASIRVHLRFQCDIRPRAQDKILHEAELHEVATYGGL